MKTYKKEFTVAKWSELYPSLMPFASTMFAELKGWDGLYHIQQFGLNIAGVVGDDFTKVFNKMKETKIDFINFDE